MKKSVVYFADLPDDIRYVVRNHPDAYLIFANRKHYSSVDDFVDQSEIGVRTCIEDFNQRESKGLPVESWKPETGLEVATS